MPNAVPVIILASLMLWPSTGRSQCPPEGYTIEMLLELKANGFQLEPAGTRDQLALGLAACTGHPAPDIRDGVVYGGLAHWLRGEQLSEKTVMALLGQLTEQLNDHDDEDGFRRPFAALILSEVVRTDRISPVFSENQRQQLVDAASDYLESVSDYRGFSDEEGWRHGVAHGSDLALQLVLNPAIDAAQVGRLMSAVARQVAPQNEVFYIYGEPARLARPVFYAFQRGLLDHDWWLAWLNGITDSAPLESWGQAWASNAGLAKRHNTMAFLMALHFNAVNGGTEAGAEFAAMIVDAMKRL